MCSLLTDDGVAVVHSIGSSGPQASSTNEWIRRHIFPGGAIPALSALSGAIEQASLVNNDVEVLRIHYARTLAEWNERFTANRAAIVDRMGETFARMWEFYLTSCEAAFRCWNLVVLQVQLSKHNDIVPITRDYLHLGGEAAMAAPKRYPRSVR